MIFNQNIRSEACWQRSTENTDTICRPSRSEDYMLPSMLTGRGLNDDSLFDRYTPTDLLSTAQSLTRLLGAYSAASARQPSNRTNGTVCKCERLRLRSHDTQINWMHQTNQDKAQSIQPFDMHKVSICHDVRHHVDYGRLFCLTWEVSKHYELDIWSFLLQYLNKCYQLSNMYSGWHFASQ